jgi:heme/copper-type cytochrome/quinol oxidase subunit 2
MAIKRRAKLLAGLLPVLPAQAEAGKGLHISQGWVLFALLIFGFIIPACLGTLLYFLIKYLRKERRTSYTLVIISSVLAWWGWWLLVMKGL